LPEPVRIRASSLSGLFDCPARWYAIHIEKKYIPSSSKAALGTAVHASTAVYDQSVLDGAGISIDEAAAAAVDAIHKPEREIEWGEDKPADAERVAIALHRKYCEIIAPKQLYFAVEVMCDSLLIADLNIILTGTTDRLRTDNNGDAGIVDLKTGKTAVKADGTVETKGHAYQMATYELMAENASRIPITAPAQIIGLNAAKTDAAQRVGTGYISGCRDILLGDDERPGILQTAANIIHRGDFWGNPKSMLCHKAYCPAYETCHYRR
jgi:RecB family exonuclease